MALVVAFVDDIFFQSKLLETAKQLGIELRTCATPEALQSEVSKTKPNLVVVDLNARASPLDAVRCVLASGSEIPLVGFLSHVQQDLAERARAAGCREVIPRSKLTQNLATILARTKSDS